MAAVSLAFEHEPQSAGDWPTVGELMTPHVHTCREGDTLDRAARLMWDHDCGAIPVVDAMGNLVGIVTDRDICMAAYIRGQPPWCIPVMAAAAHRVHCVRSDASIAVANQLMKMHRVRRLPVLDNGGNLVGMLSLADIARAARRSDDPRDPLNVDEVGAALVDVMRPSQPPPSDRRG